MQTRHWNRRVTASLSTLAALVMSATFSASFATAQNGAQAAAATGSQYKAAAKRNALAQLMLEENRPDVACRILKSASGTTTATDADSLYLLARCSQALGNTEEAIAYYRQVIALLPNATRPRAELAALYIKAGQPTLAAPLFADAARVGPSNEASPIMQNLAERLGANDPAALIAGAASKPWAIELFAGLTHDTNINGGPTSDIVPAVVGTTPIQFRLVPDAMPKSSWGANTSISGSYAHRLSPSFSLLFQGGASRTDYFDNANFTNDSLTLATALIYRNRLHGISASIQPSVRYLRQDSRLQESNTGVVGRVSKTIMPKVNLTFSGGYFDRKVKVDRRRDAHGVHAGLGVNTQLIPNWNFGAEYVLQREQASEDVFSRRMNGPSVYAVWQPRHNLEFIANYRYTNVTYDRGMAFFPDARDDRQHTVGLTALWDVSQWVGRNLVIRTQYMHARNRSNVAFNDNQREIFMMGVQTRF
ncbi:tetratricopeptide repeat protein [Pollutimonas sp. H1-120]|uniref:surface lipoprotein assembly modifier n=1 Tax=Pollutimonas sp. H1-120 TaxID=3148824 RepID=UPI003B523A55